MGKPSPRLTAPRPKDVLVEALSAPPAAGNTEHPKPASEDVTASGGRAAKCSTCASVYAVEYQDARCPHSLLGVPSEEDSQEVAKRGVVQACREDVNDFCAYVLRDEETHARIEQQPMHVLMHAVLQEHGRAVIMAHPESGKCEAAGARVLLASGEWARIESLTREVDVVLLDPDTMEYRKAKAGPVEENGVRPLRRVELRSGRVLRLTAEHPLFVPTGWKAAKQVEVGDFLACASKCGVVRKVRMAVALANHVRKNNIKDVPKHLLAAEPNAAVERLASDNVYWDEVVAVSDEAPEMTYALAVHDAAHCYLSSGVVSHNSSQLSVGRVLWLLGKNPELRLALICNTQTAAKKILRLIKLYIESSRELHDVFPELLPGRQWTEDQITVRRPNLSRDPTIQTLGYHGDIQGSRLDGVVADDLLDFENTRNTNIRHEVSSWWKSAVMGRLTMRAWVAFLTNAWHQDDLAHELERMGWPTLRFPIYDEAGNSTWPARWPQRRIEEKRTTEMGELAFTRLFLCKPRDDGAIVFIPAAIAKCKRNGQGYGLVDWLDDATSQRLEDAGAMVVTGVDLAVTRRLRGGITCAFTLLFHPDGTRQVLGIRSGRWGGREILANLAEVGAAYGGVIVVEDNGAQRYLVELAQETGESHVPVPVVPFYTGANKADPQYGLNSMAAEFEAGRWVVPVGVGVMRAGERVYVEPAEVRAWVGEMLAFDPDSHPGDRLMASWIARAYGARRMRLRIQGESAGVSVRAVG